MEWWGPSVRVEREVSPDALVYIAYAERRKGDLLVAGVSALAGLVAVVVWGSWYALAFGLIVAGAMLRGWVLDSTFSLTVTQERIGGMRWKDVSGLRYEAGGEDGPSGLAARTGVWSSQMLLESVDAQQSKQIIGEIYERFPHAEMMEERPTALENLQERLFGLTTLFGPATTEERKDS